MQLKKGFTLIELLVVIGIMAVLAAGVVALIDPVDKNRAAMDSKVQNDIGSVATALQSNVATTATGLYVAGADFATAMGNLVTAGELTSPPVAPSGYTYTYTGGGTASVVVSGTLKSKKYTATPFWVWCSSTGRAGAAATASTCP